MKKNEQLRKGQLANFPVELIEIMLKRQKEQGNPRNVTVFQEDIWASTSEGGFDWMKTPEGHKNWEIAIVNGNFDPILNHPANLKVVTNHDDPVSEIEQLEIMASKIIQTLEAKNHDYAGSTGDFFANFRKHGTLGFLVRMSDKMARLEAFEKQGALKVSDEKIEDTLEDLAGYAMLMAVYLKQVKEQPNQSNENTGKQFTLKRT